MEKQKEQPKWQVEVVPDPEPKGWAFNRPLAALVLVAVVLISGLLGVSKGVRGQYHKLDDVYAEGTDGSGYGVAYYAAGMLERASNLCKLAEKSRYEGAYAAHTQALRDAISQVNAASGVTEDYEALQELIRTVDALNLELQERPLEAADAGFWRTEYQSFTDQFYKAHNVAVDYNERARQYNSKVLGEFPASALKGLLHLPTAEEFS